jgi:flagellar hook protein FlgE
LPLDGRINPFLLRILGNSRWHGACLGTDRTKILNLSTGDYAMSLYSSMNTAISGLTAQSRALGHISDNVANSQTVGFKRTDTNFVSLITESNNDIHRPGTVLARPDFTNQLQGNIEQVENALALAISGDGFFTAALPIGTGDEKSLTFDSRNFYTRAGDFNRNDKGYMVNGAGYVLKGWPVTDGVVDKTKLVPIQIEEDVFTPTPTEELQFVGNLNANGTTEQSTSIQVIDSLGNARTVTLTFTPTAATTDNTWTLSIVAPDSVTYAGAPGGTPTGTLGSLTLQFGQDPAGTALDQADGTLANFTTPVGNLAGSTVGTGLPANVTFTADFGTGNQTFSLNLGNFGSPGGLTQFAKSGTSGLSVSSFTQDGIPLGAFSSVSTGKNGDIRINYDNGQNRVIARAPLTLFADPDKLERLDGQAFLRSNESGEARDVEAGEDGAGNLTTRAIERSNVDIASEFTKLILAQRAYSANTKIVTTSDELLQETLNMKR